MKYIRIILAISGMFTMACKSNKIQIAELRCEYMHSPINIDTQQPRFTWTMESASKEAIKQSAYQLELASSLDDFEKGKILWTSDKIAGAETRMQYTGKELFEAHKPYYWRVKLWDEKGNSSTSGIDSFRTAKLAQTDWKAQWISDNHDKQYGPAPMFRKKINIEKEIQSAYIYVSAAAYYKLFINEEVPNSEKLDPGYTHYDKRNLYTSIDVTKALRKGENVIAAVLGNGFYNEDAPVATWDFEKARWRNRACWIMELHVHMKDGSVMVLPTDQTWKTATGPYVYNNIYSGDWYDATQEITGWNAISFEDKQWEDAKIVTPPSNKMVSQTMPPMRVTKEFPAVAMKSFGDSVYVFEMGVNLTGVCQINLSGQAGTKITLTHGELIKPSGRIEMRNLDIYYKPMKDIAFQTDTYILKGQGEESFTPEFTYHGFRYVEVRTDRPIQLDQSSLKALFIHTDMENVGSFSCSNDMLNKIWAATNQTYLNNVQGIPTDCPQREKNGWTADGHIAIDLALLNFDGIKFYEKWLADFEDNQRPEGNISGIIPSSGWGYDDWIGPVWDAAMFIIPDALERYYGDATAIKKIYPACERYLTYLKNRENAEGTVTYGIGDWVFYKTQTPTDYTTTCFYYWDQVLMARFAQVVGKDPRPYLNKAVALKELINKKYFNPALGQYANGSQTSYAVALALDIVPKEQVQRVAENLNQAIVKNNYQLDFGVLGSKYVLRMLTQHGYAETAYKMAAKDTAPSWGNWIKNGLNTLGETWVLSPDFRDASINHVFLGDISAWMVNSLAGINYDTEKRGFEHIIIKPEYIKDLQWAKASYKSVKGLISSEWKRSGDQITLAVQIPANCTASIYTDKQLHVSGGYHEFIFKP